MSAAAAPRAGRGREHVVEALLDAAERLLVSDGHGAITTRRLGEAAGVNHGLVHYYFGSLEELFLQALERFTDRLVERQRALYAGDEPFLAKWRRAIAYMEEDIEAGYPRLFAELAAMARGRPPLRARLVATLERWDAVLAEAFAGALDEYGLDPAEHPPAALVALVRTVTTGVYDERSLDYAAGHRELLAWVDGLLAGLERSASRG